MFKIESLETDSKNFVSFVVKKFIGFLNSGFNKYYSILHPAECLFR